MSVRRARKIIRFGQTGITLVEVMVVVTILGILASMAFPAFSGVIARSRLRAAGEQLRSDFNIARTESQKRNTAIVMSFRVASDGSWCYGLTQFADCNCTVTDDTAITATATGSANATYCFLDMATATRAIKASTSSSQFPGITMDASSLPFAGNPLSFSPVRPTLASGNATFTSTVANASLRVVSSGLGRVRTCSPSSTLPGYPACS